MKKLKELTFLKENEHNTKLEFHYDGIRFFGYYMDGKVTVQANEYKNSFYFIPNDIITIYKNDTIELVGSIEIPNDGIINFNKEIVWM